MTYAPDNLIQVRRLLLQHLDMQPGRVVPSDLDPAEVGIVGDPAHVGGYHCGADRVRRVSGVIRDYSVVESSRDRSGLTNAAAALDVGDWSTRVGGKTHNLRSMSVWLVAQCKAGSPDTRDIREVIYSPDGTVVRRWDRLGKRSSGDGSHRWHTHISYHRDAIRAGRDQTAVWRRYLTEIGLIQPPPPKPSPVPEPAPREEIRMVRIKAKGSAARYLSNGAHIPSMEVDRALERAGVPLVEVATTAELEALLPPAQSPAPVVELDYRRLAVELLRAAAGQD